jgi:anaerobic ribonucleoside-triphosphate reductase activating protein
MHIQFFKVVPDSYVDGPGKRTAIFLQGCPIACPGCQNRHLWPSTGGCSIEAAVLARTVATQFPSGGNITITGGEPFSQPAALLELVTTLRDLGARHILIYTGYTWEQLVNPAHPAYPYLKELLPQVDVLVDGPYIRSQDDPLITWRGSRNQRPIDVAETLEQGRVVTLDWDAPTLTISAAGEILLPIGLAPVFVEIGSPARTRMCGQTRGTP